MLLSVRDLKAIKIPLQKAEIIFISVVSISAHLFSAFEHYPSNPVAVGSGLLFINVQANAIGIFADPASVTSFQVRSIGIVSGRRFGLKRLQHHSAVLAQPYLNKKLYFATGASFFGDKLYSETIWGMVMGKRVSEKLNIGIGLMYYDLQIKNYGQASSWGLNLGWRIKLDKSLQWLGSWRNLNSPAVGVSKDEIPQIIVSALVFNPIQYATVVIEWEQDTLYESRLKMGGQFKLLPWATIHAGHASSPGQTTAGFEILFKHIKINYAVSTHSYLDLSHWFGVGFSLH